ncbi:MAG: DNA-3-methyladenine glycosylase [Candidatus Omnitrophica bacterium]|nr:DNA-3-methyladenine glycosylase [Candidatus Omnitrophota bacterium]
MKILPRQFYERSSRIVAVELLGKVLVVPCGRSRLTARIVETEAYNGRTDPASHAYHGPTPRNKVMFGPAGYAYVYFIYGNHYCFNIVTEKEGIAGAVLIRAVEPMCGLSLMKKRRQVSAAHHMSNGPGKLTHALGITKKHSGCDVVRGVIVVREDTASQNDVMMITVTPRIGIREGKKLLYRFYIKGNKFISRT